MVCWIIGCVVVDGNVDCRVAGWMGGWVDI